jgi:hypothetical protein
MIEEYFLGKKGRSIAIIVASLELISCLDEKHTRPEAEE